MRSTAGGQTSFSANIPTAGWAYPATAILKAGVMRRLLMYVAAGLVWASSTQGGALQDENVLLPIPPGFKVGSQSSPRAGVTITEYVPASESVDNWSQMVTQQIFHGRKNDPPDGLPTFMSGGWKTACPGGAAQKLGEETANGYPAAVWAFICLRNPQTGKPESMWIKVISGSDSLYSVQYAIRSDVTADAARSALAYLRGVTVCDTRRVDRSCPKGM
ncbi:MAG TPA: hypothetical protein VHN39_03090 [Phenylobacterium sp.]|jgi:hypothetical protein|nr:hypothetical protein [Phenylobacterium sp.]